MSGHLVRGLIPSLLKGQSSRACKIVGTLGPASNNANTLGSMVQAGLDVVRLNFSHGSHEQHAKDIELVREVERTYQRPIAILQDLCGPKIRTTKLKDPNVPLSLKAGNTLKLVCDSSVLCEGDVIGTVYEDLQRDLLPGMRVLLSDGTMELRVERVEGSNVYCRVIYGGTLKGSQGINIPDAVLSGRSVTEKDVNDLLFGLDAGVDMVAVSFVQNEKDIKFVRSKMSEHFANRSWQKHLLPIISKIEVPEALRNISSILEASDAIMVARGDLGVELPSFEVPIAQKRLVMQANKAGKPVIVATQMLESMIHSAVPTRAEVSDVSNAIFDGADACMLSGETSVGKFPVLTVQMMSQIASTVSKNKDVDSPILVQEMGLTKQVIKGENPGRAVAQAAVRMAEGLGAKAIIVPSKGGTTAHMVSACRPSMPIVALALSENVARQLLLCYGVLPCITDETCSTMKELSQLVNDAVLKSGLCAEGDKVVLTGSHPVDSKVVNGTNFVKVMQVGQAEV